MVGRLVKKKTHGKTGFRGEKLAWIWGLVRGTEQALAPLPCSTEEIRQLVMRDFWGKFL